MKIFPAIDLYEGKAVRLFKGEYEQMTVYSENPLEIALDFEKSGAKYIHLVDLEGAKSGETPNIDVVRRIIEGTSLFAEIGGGIRSMEVIGRYIEIGAGRVILGTAAVENEELLRAAAAKYGDKIAGGADIKDGFIAIKGWTEKSAYSCDEFFAKMQQIGIKNIICTDVSKDGAMKGTNHELYRTLSEKFSVDITASGGVSSIEDIKRLRRLDLYGAIVGKAYYTGAVNIKEAIEAAK